MESMIMEVEASNHDSSIVTNASRAPKVASDSEGDIPLARKTNAHGHGHGNGNGKRAGSSSSSEGTKPLDKKPRVSNGAKAAKRRRIVTSDSESEAGPSSAPIVAKKEPLVKREPIPPPRLNGTSQPKAPTKPGSDSSEDDRPVATKANGRSKPQAKRKPESSEDSPSSSSESEEEEEEEEEEEKPLAKVRKAPPKPKPRKSFSATPLKKVKPEPISEDDVPLAKTAVATARVKTEKGGKVKLEDKKVKREKKVKEEEDEEEKYKWWEADANGDGSVKWTTFEHQGVLFPPSYIPLPKDVKMKYEGTALTLPPESEEVAGFFGAMLETDHAQDTTFRDNFFRDFKKILEDYPPKENVQVKSLDKCDFKPMLEHCEKQKEIKKAMTKDAKKKIKDDKERLEKPYITALIDGRKEKTGNFRAEPPGLFRGRGEHPKKGTLKYRLRPEDIIINIGKDAPIPKPNIPGKWKGVQHDNTVTWLATWKENINGQTKYVFLAAGSSWKGQSDRAKFEKARELIKHVDKIRKDYTADLKSKVMADRQLATALYFIDRLALRAGNEKGEDEADTVGCCSLRYEHVTLEPPSKVVFDFLGKDSMRFHQEVEVESQVFKNIKIFKAEPKKKGDDLFDRLTTTGLNQYLTAQMPGLSAKVFRTYNASWTFQQQLENTPMDGTVQEKISAYNTANRDVAILCNHQKTVSKNFAESFAKMGDKVRALKYQRMKLRYQLFTLEPKMKKKRPDLAEDESDMDEDFMERHEEDLLEKAQEAARKKWEKDNIKLEEEKEDRKPKAVLDERLKEIKAEFKALAKERKTRKVEPRKNMTEERLLDLIGKMDDRISAATVQLGDRDKLKDVALGTSKINYIDPRLTVAWARKYDVPLEKLFSKTLREKFPWAEAEAEADWVF